MLAKGCERDRVLEGKRMEDNDAANYSYFAIL